MIENLKRAKKIGFFFFSLFELLARIIEYHIQYAFLRLKTETNTGLYSTVFVLRKEGPIEMRWILLKTSSFGQRLHVRRERVV